MHKLLHMLSNRLIDATVPLELQKYVLALLYLKLLLSSWLSRECIEALRGY